MGATAASSNADSESAPLLLATAPSKIPEDSYHLAYITYFTLGAGYLLPWNAFITGVDYFSYLYPAASVDRIFSIVNMMVNLVSVSFVVAFAHRSRPAARINAGLALFTAALVGVPLVDAFYVKGNVGVYGGFYVTVGLLFVCGVADGMVQGSVIGTAGELPERYMQAVFAGTAASGVLVCLLRIVTKAVYPQDAEGLRKSANLYFIVGIALMVVCVVSYNLAQRLPVIKYYRDLKAQAVSKEMEQKGDEMGRELWTSNLSFGRNEWILDQRADDVGSQDRGAATRRDSGNCARAVLGDWSGNRFCSIMAVGSVVYVNCNILFVSELNLCHLIIKKS